jgi:hypothetical protein
MLEEFVQYYGSDRTRFLHEFGGMKYGEAREIILSRRHQRNVQKLEVWKLQQPEFKDDDGNFSEQIYGTTFWSNTKNEMHDIHSQIKLIQNSKRWEGRRLTDLADTEDNENQPNN